MIVATVRLACCAQHNPPARQFINTHLHESVPTLRCIFLSEAFGPGGILGDSARSVSCESRILIFDRRQLICV